MGFEDSAKIFLEKLRGYMWSAVKVLPNSAKTLDQTEIVLFQLNVSKINGSLW